MSAEALGRNLARVIDLDETDVRSALAIHFPHDPDAIERGLDTWRAQRAGVRNTWGGSLDCPTAIEDLLTHSGALTLTQIVDELRRRGLAYTPSAIRSTVDTLLDVGWLTVRTSRGRRLIASQHAAPQLAIEGATP